MPVPTRNNYLYFTRKERKGTMVLLCIITVLCITPFVLPLFITEEFAQKEVLQESVAGLQSKQDSGRSKNNYRRYDNEEYRPYDEPSYTAKEDRYSPKGELFYFDPNTLDEAGWKKLGLQDKTIATIINYRNRGGKFRQTDDIKKIWGLRAGDAERLVPYVQIPVPANFNEQHRNYSNEYEKKAFVKRGYTIVDINTADTTAFIALPGIGSKLAQRIISFREKLGGFYTTEQVAETFALPDSTYQKIKTFLQLSGPVTTININTAGIHELKQHPYIKYQLANAIVQYRTQHGSYSTVNDIRKIMIVDDALYQRVSPYLSVQ